MNPIYANQGGFLNSTLFFAIVTFLVGLLAYKTYLKRRADKVREAATVILSDIKTVTSKVRTIKQDFLSNGYLVESRFLLNSSNWQKYKYGLLPYLLLEQWEALDGYFADVMKYDHAVEINDSYFDSNSREVWVSLHRHYLKELEKYELPDPLPDPPNDPLPLPRSLVGELEYFNALYINNMLGKATYLPRRPINLATDALNNIDTNILTSTAGKRLADLAGPQRNVFSRIARWWRELKPSPQK